MLNKELEQTLNNAFVFAREHRHEFMTVEHLLLALLDNSAARDAIPPDLEAWRPLGLDVGGSLRCVGPLDRRPDRGGHDRGASGDNLLGLRGGCANASA